VAPVVASPVTDPLEPGPSTLVEKANNGLLDGETHCSETAGGSPRQETMFEEDAAKLARRGQCETDNATTDDRERVLEHQSADMQSPVMAEAELKLTTDEKELVTSEEIAGSDEVGEPTEASAAAAEAASMAAAEATSAATTGPAEATAEDGEAMAIVAGIETSAQAQSVAGQVAMGDVSTDQQDRQQEERATDAPTDQQEQQEELATEPDSQNVAPAQEDPAGLVATGDAATDQQDRQPEEQAAEPDSQSIAPEQEGPAYAEVSGSDGSLAAPQGSAIAEEYKSDAPADKKEQHQLEAEKTGLL